MGVVCTNVEPLTDITSFSAALDRYKNLMIARIIRAYAEAALDHSQLARYVAR
jgi:hypothetical protein